MSYERLRDMPSPLRKKFDQARGPILKVLGAAFVIGAVGFDFDDQGVEDDAKNVQSTSHAQEFFPEPPSAE